MKKIIIFLTLCSCSEYIVDPRGSKYPSEIIRDKMECKTLIKENMYLFFRILDQERTLRQCLKGRGHSVLN